MSQKGKVESGAELLARLGPRPSLHGLEAWAVLGFDPSPGDILELYGGEGVGKTELLLHLVCSTLLSHSPCQGCHGNRPEVIWVDCDLKFSVLRLAVLLEQQLMKKASSPGDVCCCSVRNDSRSTDRDERCDSVSSKGSQNTKPCDLAAGENAGRCQVKDKAKAESDGCCESEKNRECPHKLKSDPKNGASEEKDSTLIMNEDKMCIRSCIAASAKTGNNIPPQTDLDITPDSSKQSSTLHKSESTPCRPHSEKSQSNRLSLKRKAEDVKSDDSVSSHDEREVCDSHQSKAVSLNKSVHTKDTGAVKLSKCLSCVDEKDCSELSGEEIEKRVEECLRCVQVLRCQSSHQLVCTLHSLLPLVAANRNIALLVIDPLSAFFWSDKCSDFQHASSFLQKNMAQVASVLKTIAASYGVFVAASKQALVRSRAKEKAGSILSPAKGLSGEDNHVEFLGQAWGRTVTRRLVCSKSVCLQRGVRMTRYTLTGNTGQRQFTVGESGVHVSDH